MDRSPYFRRGKIAAAKAVLDTARDVEARLLEEQVAAEGLLTDRRNAIRFSEIAAGTAAYNFKLANAVSALVMRSGQIVRLDSPLERAMTAQAKINRLVGELSANPADAARLQALTAAASALDRARSVLDAQATEVAPRSGAGRGGTGAGIWVRAARWIDAGARGR